MDHGGYGAMLLAMVIPVGLGWGCDGGLSDEEPLPDIRTPECSDPLSPVFCPALNGVPATCWPAATVCSTITRCPDGSEQACGNASQWVDCATRMCVGTRNRVRGLCIRRIDRGPYAASCCPDVIKEECLTDPGVISFAPDEDLESCKMRGLGEDCGLCCYGKTI